MDPLTVADIHAAFEHEPVTPAFIDAFLRSCVAVGSGTAHDAGALDELQQQCVLNGTAWRVPANKTLSSCASELPLCVATLGCALNEFDGRPDWCCSMLVALLAGHYTSLKTCLPLLRLLAWRTGTDVSFIARSIYALPDTWEVPYATINIHSIIHRERSRSQPRPRPLTPATSVRRPSRRSPRTAPC